MESKSKAKGPIQHQLCAGFYEKALESGKYEKVLESGKLLMQFERYFERC